MLCIDEQPERPVKDTRQAVAATAECPVRADYVNVRAGKVTVPMSCEPSRGWWEAAARERRTKADGSVTSMPDDLNTCTRARGGPPGRPFSSAFPGTRNT